jgi:hypothetical protein
LKETFFQSLNYNVIDRRRIMNFAPQRRMISPYKYQHLTAKIGTAFQLAYTVSYRLPPATARIVFSADPGNGCSPNGDNERIVSPESVIARVRPFPLV